MAQAGFRVAKLSQALAETVNTAGPGSPVLPASMRDFEAALNHLSHRQGTQSSQGDHGAIAAQTILTKTSSKGRSPNVSDEIAALSVKTPNVSLPTSGPLVSHADGTATYMRGFVEHAGLQN